MNKPDIRSVRGKGPGGRGSGGRSGKGSSARQSGAESEPFRLLVENSAQGVLVQRDFQPIYANLALLRLFGYDSLEDLRQLESTLFLVTKEERPRVEEIKRTRRLVGNGSIEYQVRGLRKDGSTFWLEILNQPIQWEDAPAVHATFVDITDRKEAEEALDNSEGNFRQLMDHATEGIFIADRHARIVMANPWFCRMLGYEAGELEGRDFAELVEPEDLKRRPLHLKEIYQGKTIVTERRFLRKDGSLLTTEITGRARGDGMLQGFVRDIGQRKEAEQDLAASQRLLQTVIDTVPYWIYVKDTDSRYLMLNRALLRFYDENYGWDEERLIGCHVLDLPVGTAEERASYMEADREMFESGKGLDVETAYTLPDGSTRSEREIKYPLRDESGKITGQVGMSRDITKRIVAEEALRDSEEKFRYLVEGSIQGIFIMQDHTTVFANRAYANMFGYDSEEEMLGRDHLDFVVPEDAKMMREYRQIRLSGGEAPARYPYRGIHKDGSILWVDGFRQVVNWRGRPAIQATVIDITEHKKSEESLRQSEAKFRDLAEGSIQGIEVHDGSAILFANKSLARIFGYDSPEEVIGRPPYDLFPPEVREGRKERYLKRIAGEKIPQNIEDEGWRKDGSRFPVNRILTAVEWESKPAVQATVVDISVRKRAEEDLRLSEEKFRSLVEGSLQGILIFQYSQLIFTNSSLANIFGYGSAEEMLGLNFMEDLVDPRERERLYEYGQARREGRPAPARYVFRGSRKNGETIWLENVVKTIEWEGEFAFQATLYDITQSKLAEASRTILAEAVEQAGDLILITDRIGIIEYVNPAFEKITGYTKKEAIGETPRLLKSGVQDNEFYRSMWEQVLSGKSWKGHYTNRRKDGTTYDVDAVHSPIKDADGKITNIIAVHHDISERKLLEEQLRQSQKMEALGELAGGVAHEFNNLLQVIKGYSELATRGLTRDDLQFNNLRQIISATDKASQLTSHLLFFTRQQALRLQRTNLNALVESLMLIIRPLIGVNIDVRLSLASHLPDVDADMVMIEQVLMNLCVNARDAMANGGELTISTTAFGPDSLPQLSRSSLIPGSYVRLSVSDTGMGIPPDLLHQIFNPFFTTKDPGKGTGLGLSMAYGILEQHKGAIDVSSEVGVGSVFHVFLPVPKKAGGAPLPILASPHLPTVLVAEDDIAVREFLVRMLEEEGYPVLKAADGEEALQVFMQNRAEIGMAILDMLMPKYNGMEIYKRIREKNENLPIIFCSGYDMGAEESFLHNDSNIRVFRKPYNIQDVLKAASELLKKIPTEN